MSVVIMLKYSINNYKALILTYIFLFQKKIFNLDVAILVLTPRSAGQWPTQKPYKNHFLFQKECGWPYDFCREADKVSQTYCAHIVHSRSTIFGTHSLTIHIINNMKIFLDSN